MSVFTVPVEVSDLEGRRSERVDAWADTGAFYSSLPRPALESLGIVPHERAQFMLADGRVLDNDVGYIRMRVGDKSIITLVIFAEPESEPLLGAYALEGLALAVDSLNERLVPRPWLPLFGSFAWASPHSTTRSARSRIDPGIVTSSAFAVFMLMVNTNFVGC